jgi:diguanylate cyclase (GGDEF)-like protein/PAS domain S-box-containing protein
MISNDQYRLIVESSPNMIWRSNLSTECDYFNKTWLAFTGRTIEQELGFGWAQGVHPDDYDRCVKIYLDHFEKQLAFEMDYRLKRYDGQYRWINDRGVPFYEDNGIFYGFIGSCMDVTDNIEGQHLKEMAQNDALCHTYNRQYAHQLMNAMFDAAKEAHQPLSVLMMDIDGFKNVNDNYGHNAGDIVLARAADLIGSQLRDGDVMGRYGGDEFFVCIQNADAFVSSAIAKRILKAVSSNHIAIGENQSIHVTVSIGIKQLENESTLDELINNADKMLYDAKHQGKNRVVS